MLFRSLRDFRGNTIYAVPSMFLDELPKEATERLDLSAGSGMAAAEAWRGGGKAAEEGWTAAGVRPRPQPIPPTPPKPGVRDYAVGMTVRHPSHGVGQVIEVSGNGLLRKVKVRFRTAGERSFIADKAQLEIVRTG